jgi:hypothetical protein
MFEGSPRSARTTTTKTNGRANGLAAARPDRIALWALLMAFAVALVAAVSAHAETTGTGGVGTTSTSSGTTTTATTSSRTARYRRIWRSFSDRDRRWARRTGECESGNDPNAIGGGGRYRGAFQFLRRTWRNAPRSPGGDPIRYGWRTQAVVAVSLKHKVGTRPWPVCG